MKKEPDIAILKRKRQKNVQEQNALEKYQIKTCALHFRNNRPLPVALTEYFKLRGIDIHADILLWHDQMPEGGPAWPYRGEWLTTRYRFIRYVIYLDPADKYVTEVEQWQDMTDQIEINEHKPGTG